MCRYVDVPLRRFDDVADYAKFTRLLMAGP